MNVHSKEEFNKLKKEKMKKIVLKMLTVQMRRLLAPTVPNIHYKLIIISLYGEYTIIRHSFYIPPEQKSKAKAIRVNMKEGKNR